MLKKATRGEKVIFLVTKAEKKQLEAEAARRGVSLAHVIREKLFQAKPEGK